MKLWIECKERGTAFVYEGRPGTRDCRYVGTIYSTFVRPCGAQQLRFYRPLTTWTLVMDSIKLFGLVLLGTLWLYVFGHCMTWLLGRLA